MLPTKPINYKCIILTIKTDKLKYNLSNLTYIYLKSI